jgi:PAS domain S-box-containing protein
MAELLETGQPVRTATLAVGPHGEPAEYETVYAPVDEPDGRGVCIVAVDVTEARRRDRELRESEAKLRLAVGATGMGLWSWTAATGRTEWDERMRSITGRDVPVDDQTYLAEVFHPDDRGSLQESVARAPRGGTWQTMAHRIVRPDGSIRWVMSRGQTLLDGRGEIERIVGGTVDISEHRALEEQVRHVQRLDALGQLTAGVAHNFNNILTVITSTLDLMARRGGPLDAPLIDEARLAAHRAAELVRQLMTFAGQRPLLERRVHHVGPIIEQAVEICRRTFDRHIVVVCAIDADLPPVACSPSELEQVVMNLLLNARDAVLAAGREAPRIEITVDRAPPGLAGSPGPAVRLQVRDDGVGMTPAVVARAFDPFFTTKAVGQGTGLGLATSHTIARELGGALTCSAEPGQGATFTLILPAAKETSADPPEPAPASTEPAVRAARILLVDDEEPVRRAVAGVLEDAGFVVEAVGTGVAALERLARPPAVDVALLDRSMPGAPGESYLGAIRAIAPATRVILFSGQVVPLSLASQVDGVVAKPATASELIRAIAALLR